MREWISKHKKILIAAVLVLILASAGIAKMRTPKGEVTSFEPQFEEGQEQVVNEGGVDAGIKIPGYSTITINSGTKEAAIDLTNPEENHVYFQITFLLGEEQEQIYQSKFIRPGDHLYNITLDRELEPGTYDLTIQYDTFAMDEDYSPRNGASVNCILEVK